MNNKSFLTISLSLFTILSSLQAQFKNTPEVKRKDSIIMSDIVNPFVSSARNSGETPDWLAIIKVVDGKYNGSYADRTVTKAKIYYYYGRDWSLFSSALVHYTEVYEDKEDFKLMNKNAKMVFDNSSSKEELSKAAGWIKHAVDKEPSNTGYRDTYNALMGKLQ